MVAVPPTGGHRKEESAQISSLAFTAMELLPARIEHPLLDQEEIVFVIERSKNKNVVVYESLDSESSPMGVYWLDIDPAYVEANRKKGVMSDRSEISYLEKKIAYGLTATSAGPGEHDISLVALPQKVIRLKECPVLKRPRAFTSILGREARLERIYVESKENFFGLPTVLHVLVAGVTVDTNEPIVQKLCP